VVVLAALINACRVTGKKFEEVNIVICGAGAAGYAITRLLKCIGYNPDVCTTVKEIIVCDTRGTIFRGREGLYQNKYKFILAEETNRRALAGSLADAMAGADVFIGVSARGVVNEDMIRSMNPDPVVFALANPVPEIWPDNAKRAGAGIVGTGRSANISSPISLTRMLPKPWQKRLLTQLRSAGAAGTSDPARI